MSLQLLVIQVLLLTACGRFEALNDPSGSALNPPILPSSSPQATDWTGSPTLTFEKTNGTWVTPCIAGQSMVIAFSGNHIKHIAYRYLSQDCTGGVSQHLATSYTFTIGGPDSVMTDGYQVEFQGTSWAYQIMKVSLDGKYLAIGANYGYNDASSPTRRPATWYPVSLVKQ